MAARDRKIRQCIKSAEVSKLGGLHLANKEMKVMMQGAFVLTAASFVAKILSAIYRVPYQNLAGDEGFYVYQQVYPIYGLAMTLALSGLPQFISKYVAEKPTLAQQKKALAELFPLISSIGLVLWAVTFFFSNEIARWMGDSQLSPLVRVVAFTFLLMPVLATSRGEFQGKLLMTPTAISQVIEQVIRVTVILFSAWALQRFGWSVYQAGTVAMSGAVFGGLAAIIVLVYYQKKILGTGFSRPLKKIQQPQLFRRLVVEGGLMTIYSGFLILFQLVDSFTIKKALVAHGLTEQGAKIAKGVYDRGQPLVQLGLVIALALSASFLPILTRYLNDRELFVKNSQIFLRLTSGVAAAASVGLALLMPLVNYGLFKDQAGNGTLTVFVLAIFLMALIQAHQSIAQSQNRNHTPLVAAGSGLAVKIATTTLFTRQEGTLGASLATIFSLFVTLVVLQRASEKSIQQYRKGHFTFKLLVCLMGMSVVILSYYGVLHFTIGDIKHRSQALLLAIVGVGLGGSGFILLAIRLKLLTLREWLLLPFGAKILRINWKKEGK